MSDGTLGHAIHQLILAATAPVHVVEKAIADVNARLHAHIEEHPAVAGTPAPAAPEAHAEAAPAGEPAPAATA